MYEVCLAEQWMNVKKSEGTKKRKEDKEYSEDTHRIDLNDRAEPVLGEARDGREEVASGA